MDPRQLERWQTPWGLVEPGDSPTRFDQARQVHELLDQNLDLAQIAIVQFMRRRYVRTSGLKRALRETLDEELGEAPEPQNWKQAERQAAQQARQTTKQLQRDLPGEALRYRILDADGRGGAQVNKVTGEFLTVLFMLAQYGEAPTRDKLVKALEIVGLPPAIVREKSDQIASLFTKMTRNELVKALDAATRDELEQAREDLLLVKDAAPRLGYDILGATGPEYAVPLSLLAMLILRQQSRAEFDVFMSIFAHAPSADTVELG